MNATTLFLSYLCVGVASGAWALWRRGRTAWPSAVALVLLWPLWLPFEMGEQESAARDPTVRRIITALDECDAAARGTELDDYLDGALTEALIRDVQRIAERSRALQAELARAAPGSEVAERLGRACERDVQQLAELAEAAEHLRAELVLARYGSAGDVRAIVDELSARVEGLRSVSG
ncbi:MAG: hypothetical protein R3B13_05625 [Polyangiaceae bacterium]